MERSELRGTRASSFAYRRYDGDYLIILQKPVFFWLIILHRQH